MKLNTEEIRSVRADALYQNPEYEKTLDRLEKILKNTLSNLAEERGIELVYKIYLSEMAGTIKDTTVTELTNKFEYLLYLKDNEVVEPLSIMKFVNMNKRIVAYCDGLLNHVEAGLLA